MLPPGSTIGILGGGQLGRMLALAAAEIGMHVHIFSPEKNSPAFEVSRWHTCAAYQDDKALAEFARTVDVTTYEFENVPTCAASLVEGIAPLRPGVKALTILQDRLVEKRFLASLGIKTAPFRTIDSVSDLESSLEEIGLPAVLKTRRFGYDGKGQVILREGDTAEVALAKLGYVPAILESFVPFTTEASIIAAHGTDDRFAAYDLCENKHRNQILDTTTVPANLSLSAKKQALEATRKIAESLNYVGVLAVEFFVINSEYGESILVNEIAPRVHNSGHWTIEGARTSQFAQHIRAISGWPLGATDLTASQITMTNIIGNDIENWDKIAEESGTYLHLYGKEEARPGRKMGHVTRIAFT